MAEFQPRRCQSCCIRQDKTERIACGINTHAGKLKILKEHVNTGLSGRNSTIAVFFVELKAFISLFAPDGDSMLQKLGSQGSGLSVCIALGPHLMPVSRKLH